MSSKEAIISDLHFGCHSNSEVWHQIMIDFGIWFKQELTSREIKKFTIMGDFFDNRNEIGVQTLSIAGKFMDMFDDFEICIISGNHDMFYKNRTDVNSISIFTGRKNVTVVSDITTKMLGNLKATYIPWGCDVTAVENSDIIFGHLEINGFYMIPGKTAEGKIDPKTLLSKSDLIFSGHFHLRDERAFPKGKIIYTGSPYQLNWGEMSNIPGFYILNYDDKSYSFVENSTSPRHIKISATDIDPDKIKNNIISVDVSGLEAEEQKRIRNSIFSASPLETRFLVSPKTFSTENIESTYDDNIELIDIMFKFTDELAIGALSVPVKDKLKQLYQKYSI